MILGDSDFAQLVGHAKVTKQFHAPAVGDVHLRVRGGRRVAFHQDRGHALLGQRQSQRQTDGPTAEPTTNPGPPPRKTRPEPSSPPFPPVPFWVFPPPVFPSLPGKNLIKH